MHKKIIRKIVVKVLGNRIKKSPPKGHCQEMKCVLGREKTYFKVLGNNERKIPPKTSEKRETKDIQKKGTKVQ